MDLKFYFSRRRTRHKSFRKTNSVSYLPEVPAQNSNKRVLLNIGGQRFETYKSTLNLIMESRLANLTVTNSDYDPIRKEFFFDRDPNSFMAILNYYRTGKLHAPLAVCANLFNEELNFWGICEGEIQPCCWTTYSSQRDCDQILRKVIDEIETTEGVIQLN